VALRFLQLHGQIVHNLGNIKAACGRAIWRALTDSDFNCSRLTTTRARIDDLGRPGQYTPAPEYSMYCDYAFLPAHPLK
jgi:hypothetical protein